MQNKGIRSVSNIVKGLISSSIKQAFDIEPSKIPIQVLYNDKAKNDFQSAFGKMVFNQFKKTNQKVAAFKDGTELAKSICEKIMATPNTYVSKCECNDDGFVFIKLHDDYLLEVGRGVLENGIKIDLEHEKQTIVCDFSSPNIAKEMHVGHLRSTIMGETVCRIFEFMGYTVHRQNHIGDWGTQFGMLICYLFDAYPDCMENMPNLSDLESFYVAAKKKFTEDPEFKEMAQNTVVKLQSGEPDIIKAWKVIVDISRSFYLKIYERLNITNNDCGESFYNDRLDKVVEDLSAAKVIAENDGAMCYFMKKNGTPLIVRKSNGGYGYAATDLAAVRYRVDDLKANRIIILTDLGQSLHFSQVFSCAKEAGWDKGCQLDHMGFGLIFDENGDKFSSSKGGSFKLNDLLDIARDSALEQLKERNTGDDDNVNTKADEEDFEKLAEVLGVAAVRYFDMRQSRNQNYKFIPKNMIAPKGDTAVYLLYSYARICSIMRKSGLTQEQINDVSKLKITDDMEKMLLSHVSKFTDMIETVTTELALNKLCSYTYDLACTISSAYSSYRILGDEDTHSRVVVLEIVRRTMEQCLNLLGITPLEKI